MTLRLFGACVAMLAWASPTLASPLAPDDVVRAALAHDPSYRAALADVVAARGALRAATFLRENPTLSADFSLTSDLASGAFAQPISLTGEGLAARSAAAAQLEAARQTARRAAFVTATDARRALATAIAAESRATIASQAFDQSTARRVAIEARVRAGDASPLDGRLARLEEGQAAEVFVSARSEARAARVALARFLPDAGTVELPGDPLLVAPEALGGGARSDLRAAQRRVDAARATQVAARAAILPALSVGAFVERDDGVTSVGPSIGLTVPLWKRNPAGIAAAERASAIADAEASSLAAVTSAEQAGGTEALRAADGALARIAVAPAEDGRAALDAIAEAQARGELDPATATLLRIEILDAWTASVALRLAVADARLTALLANEDAALLPPELREMTP